MNKEHETDTPVIPERAEKAIDRLPKDKADPFTAILMILSFVAAVDALTGWKNEWDERTTIGRVGFVLSVPVRLLGGIVAGSIFLMTAFWQLLIMYIFAVPGYIHARYREVALKEP